MMYRIYSKGTIEVITGPMFSGKSEELIKRIKILGYGKIKTLVIKSAVDSRWSDKQIISRAGGSIETVVLKKPGEILDAFKKDEYSAVAIDEVQFFDDEIVDVIQWLADNHIRVIVSGLDMDFEGKPFGIMPHILAIADLVDKQQAVCAQCGNAATMSYRMNNSGKVVQVGDKEYEPRCRACHYLGRAQKVIDTQEVKIKK